MRSTLSLLPRENGTLSKPCSATFDFVNGKWTRHLGRRTPETTPPQEPKKPQKLHKGGFDSYPDNLPGQMEMSDYAV